MQASANVDRFVIVRKSYSGIEAMKTAAGPTVPSLLPSSHSQSHFWCDEWNQSASSFFFCSAPRRSTQIHCWRPAGFYCSCPSSPSQRKRRDSLHRRKEERMQKCKTGEIAPCLFSPILLAPLIDIFTSFKLCGSSIYSRPSFPDIRDRRRMWDE